MLREPSANPAADDRWVVRILGVLITVECLILLVSLIWL